MYRLQHPSKDNVSHQHMYAEHGSAHPAALVFCAALAAYHAHASKLILDFNMDLYITAKLLPLCYVCY